MADEAIEDGHDGWMEDFGEYTPLDSLTAAGVAGHGGPQPLSARVPLRRRRGRRGRAAAHRPLPALRVDRRGALRRGGLGRRSDDALGFDGLRSAVRQALSMGLSGISIWGSDIGGFFAFGAGRADAGAADPLGPVRRGLGRDAHPGRRDRGPGEVAAAGLGPRPDRQLAPLREAAHPALPLPRGRRGRVPAQAGCRSCASSRSPTRTTRRAIGRDDEFLFGPDLLAAPVLEPGATERGSTCRAGAGSTSGARRVPRARRVAAPGAREADPRSAGEVTLPAPLDELPLLARAGTVLPLLPAGVDTLSDYPDGSTTSLDERRDGSPCSPSRGARARPASTSTSGSARASGNGAGRCGSRASGGARTECRRRWRRCPSGSSHAG